MKGHLSIAFLLSVGYDAGMTAARLLRHARRSAGLSQRALAAAAGVPQSTVARIESGTISPRTDLLERLLATTGRTLASETRAGLGVDRSQIRARLALTPRERLERVAAGARTLRLLRGAARASRA